MIVAPSKLTPQKHCGKPCIKGHKPGVSHGDNRRINDMQRRSSGLGRVICKVGHINRQRSLDRSYRSSFVFSTIERKCTHKTSDCNPSRSGHPSCWQSDSSAIHRTHDVQVFSLTMMAGLTWRHNARLHHKCTCGWKPRPRRTHTAATHAAT